MRTKLGRRFVVVLLAALAVFAALVLGPSAAHAQTVGEHIADFTVAMTIEHDGLLRVHETIVYDFGAEDRHGIFRDLVRRERYDGKHDRTYDIDVISVGADPGTPAQFELSHEGSYLRVRIGDPGRTITGEHTYVLDYTVRGALRTFADHVELYWDAIGNQWPVPIDNPSATVDAPATITRV